MEQGDSGVMYTVREDAIRYYDGFTTHKTDNFKALVHNGTNRLLAVVRKTYAVLQNSVLFPAFEDALVKHFVATSDDGTGVLIEKYAEVSHFGEHACVRYRIPALAFEVNGKVVVFELYIWNSFGSRSVRIGWRALRLICTNGMVGVNDVDVVVRRHTSGLDVSTLVSHVPFFINAFKLFGDRAIAWQRAPLSESVAEELLRHFPDASDKWVLAILARFHKNELTEHGETLWALVNSVTWWASHDDDTYMFIRGAEKRDNVPAVLHERAMKVRRWMETPYFKAVAGETQPGDKPALSA